MFRLLLRVGSGHLLALRGGVMWFSRSMASATVSWNKLYTEYKMHLWNDKQDQSVGCRFSIDFSSERLILQSIFLLASRLLRKHDMEGQCAIKRDVTEVNSL